MPSAMFSHEPPSGVSDGIIPCANSQHTNSDVFYPARLSSTSQAARIAVPAAPYPDR